MNNDSLINNLINLIRINNMNFNTLVQAYTGNQNILNNMISLLYHERMIEQRQNNTEETSQTNRNVRPPSNNNNNNNNNNSDDPGISFSYTYDINTPINENNNPIQAIIRMISLMNSSNTTNNSSNNRREARIVNYNDLDNSQEDECDIIKYDNFEDVDNPINASCPITHESFYQNYSVYQIKRCKHIFNPSALQRWLDLNHDFCPVCRQEIFETNS